MLVLAACRPSPPTRSSEVVPIGPPPPPSTAVEAEPPPTAPPVDARIAFRGEDPNVLQWDFDVRGFPAIDATTNTVLVADLSHGHIATSLSLSLRWLTPNKKEPQRIFAVLPDGDVSHIAWGGDENSAVADTAKLAKKTRQLTSEANALLRSAKLRSMIACTLQSPEGGVGCVHPQRVTCGTFVAELKDDTLTWQDGPKLDAKKLGFKMAPQKIGDGPPHEMMTCFEEAHLDPVGHLLAMRIEISCKGGGSDACFYPAEWRASSLR